MRENALLKYNQRYFAKKFAPRFPRGASRVVLGFGHDYAAAASLSASLA